MRRALTTERALLLPRPITEMPFTPSNRAPPCSAWSSRFLMRFRLLRKNAEPTLPRRPRGNSARSTPQQNTADGLEELEQHIACESIADHHIEVARKHIPAFAVPGEVEPGFVPQQFVGLQGEIVPFALLFADVQQADAWPFHLQHIPAVDLSLIHI